MLHPERSPLLAATATASDPVRKVITTALKFRDGYHLENLGNFRSNMTHGPIHHMEGGQKSFHETCKHFPKDISEAKQTIVFVNDYGGSHAVVAALRKHFGLSGKAARRLVSVYHSLKNEHSKKRIQRRFKEGKVRILVSTEAMTMVSGYPIQLHASNSVTGCGLSQRRGNYQLPCTSYSRDLAPTSWTCRARQGYEMTGVVPFPLGGLGGL
jgi:superfamily II DNA/RNA helicase